MNLDTSGIDMPLTASNPLKYLSSVHSITEIICFCFFYKKKLQKSILLFQDFPLYIQLIYRQFKTKALSGSNYFYKKNTYEYNFNLPALAWSDIKQNIKRVILLLFQNGKYALTPLWGVKCGHI